MAGLVHTSQCSLFKFLRGSRAATEKSAATLVSQYLQQDAGSKTASNVPTSQRYYYASPNQRTRTEMSPQHKAIQLRLGEARLLTSTGSTGHHINNFNNSYPLYYADTSPSQSGLCGQLVHILHQLRIRELTQLQGALIPLILKGKHVIAHSDTGTGKSFGIALAVVNRILRDQVNYRLHTIILVPTEELALQYEKWLRHLAGPTSQMVQVAIESIPLEVQLTRLHNIQPHVLVGTPQRVGTLNRLSPTIFHEKLRRKVDCLVLDEADLVLSATVPYGRHQELDGAGLVDRLFRTRSEEVPAQLVAVSATVDSPTARLLNRWTRNDKAVRLTTSFSEHSIPHNIQFYFFASSSRYSLESCLRLLLRLIVLEEEGAARVLLLTSRDGMEAAVKAANEAFPMGRERAALLFSKGSGSSFSPPSTSTSKGHRTVRQRGDVYVKDDSALSRFVEGELLVGVMDFDGCRGLHVNNVTHVILYGACPASNVFLHCAGRTGRMGKEGKVIVLFPPSSGRQVQQVCEAVEVRFHASRIEAVEKTLEEREDEARVATPTALDAVP